MGLLDKLKNMVKETQETMIDKISEATGGIVDFSRSTNDAPEAVEETNLSEQENYNDSPVEQEPLIDESEFEEEELEEDEELEEFEERVDEFLSSEEWDEDDYAELVSDAEAIGISNEQFQRMFESRKAMLEEELDELEREVRYARSKWRRCPKCHSLVCVEDEYCYWCGYQLRTHPLTTAAAIFIAAASANKHNRPFDATAARNRMKQPVKRPAVAAPRTTPSATQKSPLFGSKTTSTTSQKSPLFGSKTVKTSTSEPKRSLFGGGEKKSSLLSHKSDAAPRKSSSLLSHKSDSAPKKSGSLLSSSSSKGRTGLLGGSKSSSSSRGGSLLGKSSGMGLGKKRR